MQFLTLAQVQNEPFQKQYKYPIALTAIGFVLVAAISLAAAFGAVTVGTDEGVVGIILLGWLAFCFAIFALFMFKVLRDRLRPTNWFVRLQTRGLLVKYRSYLNPSLPVEDPIAVFISFSDVEWIRENRIRRTLPRETAQNSEMRFEKYAEFKLRRESDLKELETRLAAERQTMGPYIKTWYGGRRGLSRHYPVHISTEGLVRMEWGVRPGLSSFLKEMKSYVQEAPGIRSSVDYSEANKLSAGKQEELLIELLATGDRIGAVRVARTLYGFNTTRAVQFLEELSPSGSKGSSSPRA